jgi:NAD(P)-dependent dehydrogenase (short-subunit alcohol dehydrogenase family)
MDAEGWRVFAGVRRVEDAEVLRTAASERLIPLTLDIADAEQVVAAAKEVEREVGEVGLDGLVNNAGIGVFGPLETLPVDDFRRQIEINLTAQLAVTQAMLPLIRQATGRIVFVSSVGGRIALPFGGAYHASKYGIEAVTDSLRQELRPWGIEVAAIEPGSVDTAIWERGEQIADEVAMRTPAAQEELYGETIERFRAAVKRTAARGISPDRAAKAIAHALTARRPRTRYLVGLDARGQAFLSWLLPDRLRDRLVARIMRI